MNKEIKNFVLLIIIGLLTFISLPDVQATAEFFVNIQPTSYEVGWGRDQTITAEVTCTNSLRTCSCSGWLDSSSPSNFEVTAGNKVYRYPTVRAPESGSGSLPHTYYVKCNEFLSSDYVTQSASFNINYPTSQELARYQAEQQAKSQSESAKNSASAALSSANSEINSAQNRINEASKIGADVNSATQYVNSAQSDQSAANNLFSSGNSAYSNKDYSSASSYFGQVTAKANSAQDKAANAKSMVDKIIEEYNRRKTQAQNQVSDANSAIDTTKRRIESADKVISDATVIGLDTAQAKADVATARSKIDTAEDYYKEASNMFSAKNFESAESKAQSAIQLAREADTLATNAYNRLNERLTVAGESSKAILNANTEVSQMNEILLKMDYVVRSTQKWGVDLTDTMTVLNTAKTNVDNAEDLLSQAKNRQSSGSFDAAVNSANQARDKAASSKNRLDTMTQSISINTQDALEKAYVKLELEIKDAETKVESAQATYGATPELILAAQNDLSSAKNTLHEAKAEIDAVKSASGLLPLLQKAETAFKSLDDAEQKIVRSMANAGSAKMGLVKKAAVGGAIAAGAAGGGFLYYRYKKKKKHGKTTEPKIEEKKIKKEEKKNINRCPSCDHKIKKENFCPACGEKIER